MITHTMKQENGLVTGKVNPFPPRHYKVQCTSTRQTEEQCESALIHFDMAASHEQKRAVLLGQGWTDGYFRMLLDHSAN